MAISAAAVAAVSAVVGTVASVSQGIASRKSSKKMAEEQSKVASEQAANNADQAAQARRQQIREERIRRADLLQSAESAGTEMSSGVLGAEGTLSTNLSSSVGGSEAMFQRGQRIGGFQQAAASYGYQAQSQANRAGMYGQIGSLGFNLWGTYSQKQNKNRTTME